MYSVALFMYNVAMIEFSSGNDRPKPDNEEINRILKEYTQLDERDPLYLIKLEELAVDAAAQLEAHLNHGSQKAPDSHFDELNEITMKLAQRRGHITLDQNK